jgi:holo-ACP synthase/triphosphoribosyl-dephospho-CoA synthase
MIGRHATLSDVLEAKERRAERQKELLARFEGASLISLSLNIPGSLKLSHEAVVIFEIAVQEIHAVLEREAITLLAFEQVFALSGAEGIFTCQFNANVLKNLTCQIEEAHPLGRLMDIDVLNAEGISLSREALGYPKRRCLLCESEAKACARAQAHTYEALHAHIRCLVQTHAWEESMGLWCERAMKTEVELTPKPGLVDSANSGAHRDMNIQTFYASIAAIKPFAVRFLQTARAYANETPKETFLRVRTVGIECERSMFKATQNVNTHKGMIFCLALFCAALGRLKAQEKKLTCKLFQYEIQAMCKNLVEEDLVHQKPQSAGMRFFQETGSSGIRGVAQSGFALVFERSFPFFLDQKTRFGEEVALKRTLLFLMSFVDDSTLWSRGGLEGLAFVKSEAEKILHVSFERERFDEDLRRFDQTMIQKNLSPGGSADLLALTWLISRIVES